MIKILLTGARGRMGVAVTEAAAGNPAFSIVAGVDINQTGTLGGSFPVFLSADEFTGDCDVIIDFSHHTAIEGLLNYAVSRALPIVVSTTGHTDAELETIERAAAAIPIFRSRNMSVGVNMLVRLARQAAAALEGYDVEIIEKHHNNKLDAPSGTALMLAEAVAEAEKERYSAEFVYERQSRRQKRAPNEIGIHSIRGGTIVGEHDVLFAGTDEVITLSHSASSRNVFASGALRAASFLIGKPAGMYNMDDLLAQAVK